MLSSRKEEKNKHSPTLKSPNGKGAVNKMAGTKEVNETPD